jgi:hypothetical protein
MGIQEISSEEIQWLRIGSIALVFWVPTLCGLAGRYQYSSKMLVSVCKFMMLQARRSTLTFSPP